MLLSGCDSAVRPKSHSIIIGPSACPATVQYSSEQWEQTAAELAMLPEDAILVKMLDEYMDLIDQVEKCN